MTPNDKDIRVCAAKVLYATRTIAKREAKRLKRLGRGAHNRVRPYQCNVCGLWHLTSELPRLRDMELAQ